MFHIVVPTCVYNTTSWYCNHADRKVCELNPSSYTIILNSISNSARGHKTRNTEITQLAIST